MRVEQYLKDKLIFIVLQVGIILFISFVLSMLKVNIYINVYLTLCLIFADVLALLWDFTKRYRYYSRIQKNLDQMEQKHLISGIMDNPSFIDGEILFEIIHQATKSMNDEIAMYKIAQEEYREYIETWIHEVKTPIACIDLLCENNKNELTDKIEKETKKVDGFIEQALFYARSTNVAADYSIKRINLDDVLKRIIKKHSKQLIEANAQLSFDLEKIEVYADEKWLGFIIGQIIANSVKYKKEDLSLSFSMKQTKANVILFIKDNGIGISESDLSRVFQKGFTGENGRKFAKSTGMGLYICKTLCDKMYLKIEVDSQVNQGVEVRIIFPKEKGIE